MKKFVNTNGEIFYGEDAEKLLKEKNDIGFISTIGIAKISEERWREAQLYEKGEWMDRATDMTDDRNVYHMKKFDNYELLKGKSFDHAIELGCGPFTNMRLIKNVCEIKELSLLDPLLPSYINHPGNQFKSFNHDKVQLHMHPVPCEDPRWCIKTYDLIVMINVLEHVYDVPKIFENIYKSLSPGGIFIFSDVVWKSSTIKDMAGKMYNAGHPIRLDADYVESKISDYHELFRYNSWDYEGKDIQPLCDIYFIGQKPSL